MNKWFNLVKKTKVNSNLISESDFVPWFVCVSRFGVDEDGRGLRRS